MLSGKSKGLDVNISLVKNGDIVTDPQIVSHVFNDYYVNIAAGIRKPDSIEAGQTISDIAEVYNNHESVSYIRNNCRALNVMSFTKVCPDDVRKRLSGVNTHKATGHDVVAPKLIKLAAGIL